MNPMFHENEKLNRRAFSSGVFGLAIALGLAACGGKDATPTAAPTTAPTAGAATSPTNIAPVFSPSPTTAATATTARTQQPAVTATRSGASKATSDGALLSKQEIETVLGRPVGDPKETSIPDGTLISYHPIMVQVLHGTSALYGVSGFRDNYGLTEPVPEFGKSAFASQSDIVALKGETLVYIGSAGMKIDGITQEMLKTLMRTAMGRI
jgi:hypothetical protein